MNQIKKKINNHYQVFDKDLGILRDCKYSDFVVLMDRASGFDLYKKIFEYMNIPLTKYTYTSITGNNDLLIIKKARCLNEDNYILNVPDLDDILQVLKEVE